MPRMWADKTVDELREEWLKLHAKLERLKVIGPPNFSGEYELHDAIEAIELEIGRRKVPLVVDVKA